MLTIHHFKRFAKDPLMGYFFIKSRISKKRLFSEYSKKSLNNNLKKMYFILSFDCDTELDIEVVTEVNNKLRDLGITPVYAVPGELLEIGKEVYRQIQKSGAEFINHGFKTHTKKLESGKYISCLDYCELTNGEILEDISLGHDKIIDVLGSIPMGFRTPHFGNYQTKENLEYLHDVLLKLKYKYSTSTIPYHAYKNGALYDRLGIKEIPVTGLISEPLRIFDSFLYCDLDTGEFDEVSYYNEGMEMISKMKQMDIKNGIINIYVDPSQIYRSTLFFDLMKAFKNEYTNVTYEGLMEAL